MENDTAIKILKMRIDGCSWGAVAERFGNSSSVSARDVLKYWAKQHEIDISWAVPPSGKSVVAPKGWAEAIEKKLGRKKPPTRRG
tara:strand:+ start:757 stop:1011 length:255 start_codon:yes stop_codon:yes gene_type:complete